jgi:hypothetical protein
MNFGVRARRRFFVCLECGIKSLFASDTQPTYVKAAALNRLIIVFDPQLVDLETVYGLDRSR